MSRKQEVHHLHTSGTVSKIWDTATGWAIELVKGLIWKPLGEISRETEKNSITMGLVDMGYEDGRWTHYVCCGVQ